MYTFICQNENASQSRVPTDEAIARSGRGVFRDKWALILVALSLAVTACGGGEGNASVSQATLPTASVSPLTAGVLPLTASVSPLSALQPAATGQLSVPEYPELARLGEVERLFVSDRYEVYVARANEPAATRSTVFETRNDWIRRDFFNSDPAKRSNILRGADQYGQGKSDVRTASFTRFSFANTAVIVTVRLKNPNDTINSVTIRPLRENIAATIAADRKSLTFRLDRPEKVSVEINDRLNPLFILTDTPEAPETTATHYFRPGIHRIPGNNGTLTLSSGQHLYIAAGAIVEGRIVIQSGASNVRIAGRGILSRGEWEHTTADSTVLSGNTTISSRYTNNLEISGLTIVNSTAWQIAIGDSSEDGNGTRDNRYFDLNLISWAGNTDAFWITGTNNILDNAFVFNNDDLIVFKGGTDTKASNIVAWGGTFGRLLLLQSIYPKQADIKNLTLENIDLIGKEGSDTLITFTNGTTGKSASKITLRNIRIEERRRPDNTNNNSYNIVQFVTLEDKSQKGTISDVLFENVILDQALPKEGFIRGSADHRFSNFKFRNIIRGGQKIIDRQSSGIEFNEFVDNVTFE